MKVICNKVKVYTVLNIINKQVKEIKVIFYTFKLFTL